MSEGVALLAGEGVEQVGLTIPSLEATKLTIETSVAYPARCRRREGRGDAAGGDRRGAEGGGRPPQRDLPGEGPPVISASATPTTGPDPS